MNIYIDLDSGNLLAKPSDTKPVTVIDVKRGDSLPLNFKMLTGPPKAKDVAILPAGTTLKFSAKTKGRFDSAALVYADSFTQTGEVTTATAEAQGYGSGVESITVTAPGQGYTTAPTVVISPVDGNGSGAAATATLSKGGITGIVVLDGGYGYNGKPTVEITGGGGSGASTKVIMNGDSVGSIVVENGGSGYVNPPEVILKGGVEHGVGVAVLDGTTVDEILVSNPGYGYTTAPDVVISGGGGADAEATAQIVDGRISGFTVTNAGTGYTSVPTVTVSGGGITPATATASLTPALLGAITVKQGGSGFDDSPLVTISGGGGPTVTSALPVVVDGEITRIELPFPVHGYTSAPAISITDSSGSGATAEVVFDPVSYSTPVIVSQGSGYNHVPTVTLNNCGGAQARAVVSNGRIDSIELLDTGRLSPGNPSASITGGAGSGATAEVTLGPASIAGFNITNGGSGYPERPPITISGGVGIVAATAEGVFSSTGSLLSVRIKTAGSGYTTAPTVTVGGSGAGAAVVAGITRTFSAPTILNGGSRYLGFPLFRIFGGGGTGAAAAYDNPPPNMATDYSGSAQKRVDEERGRPILVRIPKLTAGGVGYHSNPRVGFFRAGRELSFDAKASARISGAVINIGGGGGSGYGSDAYAVIERDNMDDLVVPATVVGGSVTAVDITAALANYAFDDRRMTARAVTIHGTGGSGATATWNATASTVVALDWWQYSRTRGEESETIRGREIIGYRSAQSNIVYALGSPELTVRTVMTADRTSPNGYVTSTSVSILVGRSNHGTNVFAAGEPVYRTVYGQTASIVGGTWAPTNSPIIYTAQVQQYLNVPVFAVFKSGSTEISRSSAFLADLDINGSVIRLKGDYRNVPDNTTSVTFEIESPTGSGFLAVAPINAGSVSELIVTNPGTGYTADRRVYANGSTLVGYAQTVSGSVVNVSMVANMPSFSSPPVLSVEGAGGAVISPVMAARPVTGVRVVSGGSGYNPVMVRLIGGGGSGATAAATVENDSITSITITNPGTGYTSSPQIVIPTPFAIGGIQASATCEMLGGRIAAINVTNQGSGYTTHDLAFSSGDATGVACVRTGSVVSAWLVNSEEEYATAPSVTLSSTPGSGAEFSVIQSPRSINSITLTEAGDGYPAEEAAPVVTLVGGDSSVPATATAALDATGRITSINLTSEGSGYTSSPSIIISSKCGSGASAFAFMPGLGVASITVTNHGQGYTSPPTILLDGDGTGATASPKLSAEGSRITAIEVTDSGEGYLSAPEVTISSPRQVPEPQSGTPVIDNTPQGSSISDHRLLWRPAEVEFTLSTTGKRAWNSGMRHYAPELVVSITRIKDAGAGYTAAPSFELVKGGIYYCKGIVRNGSVVELTRDYEQTRGLQNNFLYSGVPSDTYDAAVTPATYVVSVTGPDPIPDVLPKVLPSTSTQVVTTPVTADDVDNPRLARATAVVTGGKVVAVNLVDEGQGYELEPTVTIAPPPPGFSSVVSINSAALNTALGSGDDTLTNDVRFVDLDAEVEMTIPTDDPEEPLIQSTTTFTLRVHNDVVKGDETAPT